MDTFFQEKLFYQNIGIPKENIDLSVWLFINRLTKNLLSSKNKFDTYISAITIPISEEFQSDSILLKKITKIAGSENNSQWHNKIYTSISYLLKNIQLSLGINKLELTIITDYINSSNLTKECFNILKPIEIDMQNLDVKKMHPEYRIIGNYQEMDSYFEYVISSCIPMPDISLSSEAKKVIHKVMTNLVQNLFDTYSKKDLSNSKILLKCIEIYTIKELGENCLSQYARYFHEVNDNEEEIMQPAIPEISAFMIKSANLEDIRLWIQFFAGYICCLSFASTQYNKRTEINAFDIYEISFFNPSLNKLNIFYSKETIQKFLK